MRALSVRQPWAGAIFNLGKDVENRSRSLNYRGPLWIHTSKLLAEGSAFGEVERISGRELPPLGAPRSGPAWEVGSIIGTVVLVSCHRAVDCERGGLLCSPWAQRDQVHLLLRNPVLLPSPVPCNGRLGLWTPDEDTAAQVKGQLR